MQVHAKCLYIALLCLTMSPQLISAQSTADSIATDTTKFYIVEKNDGTTFIGKILSRDAREILIDTKELGETIIPKHEIKFIRLLEDNEITKSGRYRGADLFATRYTFTTNGFPVLKGESYVLWSLIGPDFQFTVSDRLGLGIMTSWLGIPVIGTAKYSIPLKEKINLGVGALLGTGTWAAPEFGLAVPFGTITLGDRTKNINGSFGYGAIWIEGDFDDRILFSFGGLFKINKKISLTFDSFFVPSGEYYTYTDWAYNEQEDIFYEVTRKQRRESIAFLIPSLRWHMKRDKAFQFGFGTVIYEGETQPLSFPMVQWFRTL